MWNAIVAIAAVLGVACAQVDLDGVDLVKMQRSLNGMTHFRDAPVVRDVFARDVQCYDLLFRNNAGRSMFGWVTLANEKLMEDDWSCALTLMVQLHRETRRARDAARRENGSASTEAAWHYVNASFSLAMLYTNPGVVTTLSDESPVHVARGEKLLWHVLEVVAADGLLGEDDASVRYMVDVAENVFAGADKARALTPVREDGAASYVERPAYAAKRNSSIKRRRRRPSRDSNQARAIDARPRSRHPRAASPVLGARRRPGRRPAISAAAPIPALRRSRTARSGRWRLDRA